MAVRLLVLLFAPLLLLAGCTGHEVRPLGPAMLPQGFAGWSEGIPPYQLGPGDRLEVKFLRTPEMNEEVLVRPDGYVNLQAAGPVQALDLTPEQLAERVTVSSRRLLRNPQVTVGLVEATAARIYVGGQVNAQGVFAIGGRIGAMEAILQAGGFTPQARVREVVLIRRGPDDRPMLRTLDLGGFVEGRAVDDVPLYSGDILFVPRSAIAEVNLWIEMFIDGVVPFNRSFSYSLNREI